MKTTFFFKFLLSAVILATVTACDKTEKADTAEADAAAGVYEGYTLGDSNYFKNYLLGGGKSGVTIAANSDGSINLTYKSGIADFVLTNLTVKKGAFSGAGKTTLSMSGGSGSSTEYAYTLEGSVNSSKELTLSVNIPNVMGGMKLTFNQGKTPLFLFVAATYKYNSSLSLSVGAMGSYGPTNKGSIEVKRGSTNNTVNITISGISQIEGMPMTMQDFTVNEVALSEGKDGSYTLASESFTSQSGTVTINGEKLSGTVSADGVATLEVVFKPGAMPMSITLNFSGSKNAKH